jgi:DNA-binding MarR family transcriptional regulator
MLAMMGREKERAQRAIRLIHGAISETLGLQKGRKSEVSPIALSILYTSVVKKIRMNDVSEACGIRKSTASRYVDSLEDKGLVVRRRDGEDKRIIYVEPTIKGKSLIAENEKKLAKYVEKGMARLTPAEQKKLVELLVKFTGADEK